MYLVLVLTQYMTTYLNTHKSAPPYLRLVIVLFSYIGKDKSAPHYIRLVIVLFSYIGKDKSAPPYLRLVIVLFSYIGKDKSAPPYLRLVIVLSYIRKRRRGFSDNYMANSNILGYSLRNTITLYYLLLCSITIKCILLHILFSHLQHNHAFICD